MAKDQQRIEAQQKYVTGSQTIRELAAEMGINIGTVARWSRENGWPELRQAFEQRAMQKALTKASNKRADKLAKLISASNTLEDALILAANQFQTALEENSKKGAANLTDGFRAKNLQSLANAISTATATRFALSGLMTEAEKQRLQLDKRKLRNEEKKENEKTEGQENVYTMPEELEELGK